MKQGTWRRTELKVGASSAVLDMPSDAAALFVLAHGAGAGMRHPFLEDLARFLCDEQVATLRYQFPYMERKSKRPDHRSVLLAAVRSAVEAGRKACPSLPLIAGGKSMGGRMIPMLFLQGTRDNLSDLSLLEPVCRKLGSRATLSVIEGGDHSFHMPKRSGRTDGEVLRELAHTIREWITTLPPGST